MEIVPPLFLSWWPELVIHEFLFQFQRSTTPSLHNFESNDKNETVWAASAFNPQAPDGVYKPPLVYCRMGFLNTLPFLRFIWAETRQ